MGSASQQPCICCSQLLLVCAFNLSTDSSQMLRVTLRQIIYLVLSQGLYASVELTSTILVPSYKLAKGHGASVLLLFCYSVLSERLPNFKYNLNDFPFFRPFCLKEVLCCALRTLATGLEPALLDWQGCCGMNKLGGSGGMLPQEKIMHSEIASEATFGPKCYQNHPICSF